LETEAKFVVPGSEVFAQLKALDRIGPYERRDEKVKLVHDRYVDTEDHRFYSRQLYARLREGYTGGTLVTIKRLGAPPEGAIHSRDEYEVEVPNLEVSAWPEGDVRSLVTDVAGDAALRDLVAVDQVRTVSRLYDGERTVAEMSLDEVTIGTPHEPVHSYELEVELLPDGTMSDLNDIVQTLTDMYSLEPQPLTKFERAMMLSGEEHEAPLMDTGDGSAPQPAAEAAEEAPAGKKKQKQKGSKKTRRLAEGDVEAGAETETAAGTQAEQPVEKKVKPGKQPASVEATDSMDDAGRKIVGAFFKAMLDNEEGTRAGEDPEALHDMRVATRRMRAALRVLQPYMHEQRTDNVRRGLRAVARALGAVRDLDVLIINAEAFQQTLPEEQRGDMEGLLGEWRDRRGKSRKAMLRLLNSKDYTRFTKQMARFVEEDIPDPDMTAPEVAPFQVRHVAPSAILSKYEQVRTYETVMSAPTIAQLHALRIHGKYLRYTLECFRETLPSEAGDLIREVVSMQDELGELHDADVAIGLIRDYVQRHTKRQKDGYEFTMPPGLAAYMEDRSAAIRRNHAEFLHTWAGIKSPEWRARLASVISAL
jgi:CHAD domain-containing protein